MTGTAWLSSVRVVKCNIKLFNERNLILKCFSNIPITETDTAAIVAGGNNKYEIF